MAVYTFPTAMEAFMVLPLWAKVTTIIVVVFSVLLYFWRRIKLLTHEKMELQRFVVEKNELWTYAVEREKKALEKASEIDAAKKKLLSTINHQIRTPMNGVIGMVTLLSETPLTSEQVEYNETIRSCSENLLTVINDILLSDVLAYSKVESNSDEFSNRDFNLRNAIEEVFDVFASQAAQKDVELIYHLDNKIPAHVVGDDGRLRQVLMNLLENSIKFTDRGEIYIKVWTRNKEAEILDLGFEVRDSGIGIPPNEVKFLMHSISQAGAQRTGVGLFLCNRLVNIMGGSLSIDSRVNEGTVVRFNILVSSSMEPQRAHVEMMGVEGKKVLIVEDNRPLRNVLEQELLNWKLVPVLAESGAQALEILSEKRGIDLVLAEMQMPEMDGMQLSQAIKTLYPAMPIILISAVNDEGSKQHPEILSSLVPKPIRHNILAQHLLTGLIHESQIAGIEKAIVKQKLSSDFAVKYPLTILIAEDNVVNQKLALRVLGKLGYKPHTVMNGKEVLEEVTRVEYDVILMDIQMPEMDGLEATRMIRLCLANQPIIIAMTANAMQGDREECINAGMDDYISKPVNIEELVIILEKWALQVKAKK
ncbi:response regulator [Dawidia soli]|uniref:histidine kinase n=1 Tax=Dawidia soli TaxID=2782352 RepID=A0AAP2DD85_9BACT|nr:response regulator [Dawidia soli]MBT1689894.1 response regulator [Dawidia soli]